MRSKLNIFSTMKYFSPGFNIWILIFPSITISYIFKIIFMESLRKVHYPSVCSLKCFQNSQWFFPIFCSINQTQLWCSPVFWAKFLHLICRHCSSVGGIVIDLPCHHQVISLLLCTFLIGILSSYGCSLVHEVLVQNTQSPRSVSQHCINRSIVVCVYNPRFISLMSSSITWTVWDT